MMAGLPVWIVLALAATLNAFAIWTIHAGRRPGRSVPQFLLGLFPFAIMFLVAPVPFIVWQMVRDFRTFAPNGVNIVTVMEPPARAFLPGALGFVLSMLVAAALQWHASWEDGAAESADAIRPATQWATMIVVILPLVALAVVGLCYLTQRIPRAVTERALLLRSTTSPPPFDPHQLSANIAGWLVLSFIGGLVGTFAIALMGALTLTLVRSRRFSSRVGRCAWVVAAVLVLFGVWNAFQDLDDLNWISSPTVSSIVRPHRGT